MSNPLPIPPSAVPRRGGAPGSIEPGRYPALEQLRQHVAREGIMLIDRIYAEAQVLHKRATEAEAELEMYAGPKIVTDAFPPRDVFGNERSPSAPKVQKLGWPNDQGRVVDASGAAVEDESLL